MNPLPVEFLVAWNPGLRVGIAHGQQHAYCLTLGYAKDAAHGLVRECPVGERIPSDLYAA